MENNFQISGNIVDVVKEKIFPGTMIISDGKISEIIEEKKEYAHYIIPGLIDSHIHIESSMLVPSEFARLAVVHGTVAVVSDPHEIANVLGIKGIEFMIDNGSKVPFKFFFGAPSCVPATDFETSGAKILPEDIEDLFEKYNLKYLSEMMNFPGVTFDVPDVIEKLSVAKKFGISIDGHSPGLKGEDLKKYVNAGISTDHECFTLEEAKEKISLGMKILIREGSAAKNFEALHSLISSHNDMVMLCSDDKHPDDLVKSHINELIKKAVSLGHDIFKVLKCATLNPVRHYNLEVGLLQKNDYADFIVVDNLKDFGVMQTYINGTLVADKEKSLIESIKLSAVNNFNVNSKEISDFKIQNKRGKIRVIKALEGQLITNELIIEPKILNDEIVCDLENDIIKIAVVNRYQNTKPAIGFIKNFGLKKGAIASSVAHDSHNIIAVGTDDISLCKAVNSIIENKGGIAVFDGNVLNILPLPVAGIMSAKPGYYVAEKYSELNSLPAKLGCKLHAPFMTLSFMALLVIPSLKLSDKGLFNGNKFEFVDLFTNM
jgi:adenine deaminase